MTNTQYLASLKRLGLSPHSNRTAELLGLSRRTIQRFAQRDEPQDIPDTVAKLIGMYLRYGLPPA